jgi:Na+-transporting NADH:ubiquinone oxidoreductase subunit B
MRRVLIALIPVAAEAVYFFGWRVVVLLAAMNALAFAAEYAFTRRWKEPVSSAVFVTGTLFTLSLPPGLPMWMAAAGVLFAIVFGKMVFGGFGRNIFNPALTGRAFIYVCFGQQMTAMWSEPVPGMLGGLAAYAADAVTQATPAILLKQGTVIPYPELLIGRTAGTIGGTSALLGLAGGIYLMWTKAANYRIVVSGFAAFFCVQGALWLAGAGGAAEPVHSLLAGSFVVGICFYATDPVSASQTDEGRWVYGAMVGALSSLIGVFSVWPAGTMFAVLLANMGAPLLDHGIRSWRAARSAAA